MFESLNVVLAIAAPIGAAIGAYAAVRVEVRWLREHVKSAHDRLDKHDDEFKLLWKGSAKGGAA